MAAADPDSDDDIPVLEERVLAEYGWVRALAARLLRSESDADDVTQEVITAALQRRPRVEASTGIRRWLDSVTRRQVVRWRGRGRRRREVEALASDPTASTPQPSDVIGRLQMHRALTDAVLELPDPYRSVVVARYLDGLSCAEIATQRNEREATVRQQLSRAIHKLRTKLGKQHGRDGSAALALLAFGGEQLAPLPLATSAAPVPVSLAVPAAVLTMKMTLAVLSTVCVLILAWQVSLRAPDMTAGERVAASAAKASSADSSSIASVSANDNVERQAAPTNAVGTGFVLRIVDYAGAPVPGATAVLVGDRERVVPGDFELRTTDGNGRVDYAAPPPQPPGSRGYLLLLAAESRRPQWHTIELPTAGSDQTVRFGGPGSVHGIVKPVGDATALGAEAAARPQWLLSVKDRYRREWPQGITDAFVHRGLGLLLQGAIRVDAATGAFAMHGLPDSEATFAVKLTHRSAFVIDPEHTVAERSDRESAVLHVGRPDQVIAIVPIPAMRLRAVFDDGSPAAGALGMFRPWLVDDDGPAITIVADTDGVFVLGMNLKSIPLHRYLDPANQVRAMRVDVLEIRHPAAEANPKFTFEVPSGVRWADAGEVVLRRLAEVHVLAVDRDGAPVCGAVFEATQRSQPTGLDGRTVIPAKNATQRAFRVGAPGALVDLYEAGSGSGAATDPMRFELAPENRVELQLVCDDLCADEIGLEITGPENLFYSSTERFKRVPSHLHRAAGIGQFHGGSRNQRSAVFDDDLTFTLVSLVPGARIAATAVDRAGIPVAQCEFVVPPFGEVQHLRMEHNVVLCRVDGRVITADGAPAKARLEVGEDRRRGNSIHRARTSADEHGRFRLRLVATGQDVEVRVSSSGHALLRQRLSLVEGTQKPWFTLQPGHSLTACLVGHDGKILDAAIEALHQSDLGVDSKRLPDMSTQLRRLPAGEVTLVARYAARTFVRRVDAATQQGPVELLAPRPESIPLRVAGHVATDTVLELVVFSAADDSNRVRSQLHCVDGTWQPAELSLYPGKYRVRCSGYASSVQHETTWVVTEGDAEPRWLMR